MRERSLLKSFNYAVDGLIYILKSQRNMRIHFGIAAAVLVTSLFFRLTRLEFIALLFSIALVLITELINTAIESAIDIVTTTFDPLAKIAKDVAAAAVLIASLNAIVLGYFIFFHRLNPYALTVLQQIKNSPAHVTLIIILVLVILVIAMKSWVKTKNFFKGGWPSGHSALAGALLTIIALLSGDALIATMGLILAILVFHSRLEARIHSLWEIIVGALLGILVSILIFQLFLV